MIKSTFNKKIKFQEIAITFLMAIFLLCSLFPTVVTYGVLWTSIIRSAIIAIIPALFAIIIKNGIKYLGYATVAYFSIITVFVLCYELYLIIKKQSSGEKVSTWVFFFYYDKIILVLAVWLSTFLTCFLIVLISKKRDYLQEYKSYLKYSTISFFVFYILILIYCFIILRPIGVKGEYSYNYIPFATMKSYFLCVKYQEYENLILFFGNIAIFMPLGFAANLFNTKHKLLLNICFPIIFSSIIELSQLLLKNGEADVDDVLLNCIGFYLGACLFYLLKHILTHFGGSKYSDLF